MAKMADTILAVEAASIEAADYWSLRALRLGTITSVLLLAAGAIELNRRKIVHVWFDSEDTAAGAVAQGQATEAPPTHCNLSWHGPSSSHMKAPGIQGGAIVGI